MDNFISSPPPPQLYPHHECVQIIYNTKFLHGVKIPFPKNGYFFPSAKISKHSRSEGMLYPYTLMPKHEVKKDRLT